MGRVDPRAAQRQRREQACADTERGEQGVRGRAAQHHCGAACERRFLDEFQAPKKHNPIFCGPKACGLYGFLDEFQAFPPVVGLRLLLTALAAAIV